MGFICVLGQVVPSSIIFPGPLVLPKLNSVVCTTVYTAVVLSSGPLGPDPLVCIWRVIRCLCCGPGLAMGEEKVSSGSETFSLAPQVVEI